jgi:hypothetical protein
MIALLVGIFVFMGLWSGVVARQRQEKRGQKKGTDLFLYMQFPNLINKTTDGESKMKQQSTTLDVRFNKALFAGVFATLMMVFSGAVNAQEDADYYYNDAVHYMNRGYTELGKVANKLDQNKASSATKHFNRALKDFNKAVVSYSKAVLPADEKPALDALQKGLDALQKSVKGIEKNDYVSAQNNYDKAQNYFVEASVLLD